MISPSPAVKKAGTPNKYGEMTGRGNTQVTRFAWLLKAFEHQTHHPRANDHLYPPSWASGPPNERLF